MALHEGSDWPRVRRVDMVPLQMDVPAFASRLASWVRQAFNNTAP